MSRHASLWNKRDEIEPAILRAFDDMKVPWYEGGPLDGWAVLSGRWVPCEWKSGKGGKLTKGQADFIRDCQQLGRPYMLARSVDEAVAEVNKWRSRA